MGGCQTSRLAHNYSRNLAHKVIQAPPGTLTCTSHSCPVCHLAIITFGTPGTTPHTHYQITIPIADQSLYLSFPLSPSSLICARTICQNRQIIIPATGTAHTTQPETDENRERSITPLVKPRSQTIKRHQECLPTSTPATVHLALPPRIEYHL